MAEKRSSAKRIGKKDHVLVVDFMKRLFSSENLSEPQRLMLDYMDAAKPVIDQYIPASFPKVQVCYLNIEMDPVVAATFMYVFGGPGQETKRITHMIPIERRKSGIFVPKKYQDFLRKSKSIVIGRDMEVDKNLSSHLLGMKDENEMDGILYLGPLREDSDPPELSVFEYINHRNRALPIEPRAATA